LGVFGVIAGLAALVIVGGLIARGLQREDDDLTTLRALGGNPLMSVTAGSLGPLAAVTIGSALAVVVAVGLSPLSPIGPVRAVYPDGGFAFDWPVLGIGFMLLFLLLNAITLGVLVVRTRRTKSRARRLSAPLVSRAGRLAADMGLPVPAVVGVRFALERPSERDAAPVRSALVGAVLAVTIVVATLTFGSSLDTLVSHPSLYGWNWNYALTSNGSQRTAAGRQASEYRSVRSGLVRRQLRQRADRWRDRADHPDDVPRQGFGPAAVGSRSRERPPDRVGRRNDEGSS